MAIPKFARTPSIVTDSYFISGFIDEKPKTACRLHAHINLDSFRLKKRGLSESETAVHWGRILREVALGFFIRV